MRISRSGECGNSPKNELVEDIAILLAERNVAGQEDLLTDDFKGVEAGDPMSRGRDAFLRHLSGKPAAEAITVFHVSSHGRVGAVNGEMVARTGLVAFCHVVEFGNLDANTVKTITSYLVPVDDRF
ncbi:MAG: hypothetical protein RLN72_09170 [Henriciella sp.]